MMSKSNLIQIVVLVCLLGCLCSCKKDTETRVQPAPPFATAGTNQNGIAEFSVKLNADSLKTGQAGKWTVASGLQEDNKVYFDDAAKPDTRFHGMPGEAYVLKWAVSNYSESTVKISFKPLQTSITNNAPDNQTQFYLSAASYDSGNGRSKAVITLTSVTRVLAGQLYRILTRPMSNFRPMPTAATS